MPRARAAPLQAMGSATLHPIPLSPLPKRGTGSRSFFGVSDNDSVQPVNVKFGSASSARSVLALS